MEHAAAGPMEQATAAAMEQAVAAAWEQAVAAAWEQATAAAMEHAAAGPMEQAVAAALEQAAASAAAQPSEWEEFCATTRTDWALAVYRRTTGQAARAIPVWIEQTAAIAAEPQEVKATAAVPLDWAAAMVVDPLL